MPAWFVVIFLVLAHCSQEQDPNPTGDGAPRRVESPSAASQQGLGFPVPPKVLNRIQTESVALRLVPQLLTAPGEVMLDLDRVAKVSSRIDGQVEQVFVRLGERVDQGQPLVAIGSLKLDELVQEFLVAQVQFGVTRTNYLRTKKLLEERIVSQRRFLEDRARYRKAKAVFQHVTEKLQNMGLTPTDLRTLVQGSHSHGHHYVLKAPLSGIITAQNTVLGQGVTPGDELFEVVDTQTVWVFANLPVEQVPRFKVGDRGTIVPKGRDRIEATLTYIAPVADKATLTVRVRFDVDNPRGALKPNEYVDVQLTEKSATLLTMPRSAVTQADGVRGVFVKHGPRFVFRPVTLGQEGENWVEVLDGVTEGETVAIKGVFDLKNAMLKDSIEGD